MTTTSVHDTRFPHRDATLEASRDRSPIRSRDQAFESALGASSPPVRQRPSFAGLVDAGVGLSQTNGSAGAVVRLVGALTGQRESDDGDGEFGRLWAMQAESRAFNVELLELQHSAQAENRRFTALSNLMKARHETAKNAIQNIRV